MATGDVMLTMTPLQYAEYTDLRNRLAEAERERDRYRAALVEYADRENWHALTFNPGRETNWIGGGEGPDLAEKAIASTKESEAS